MGIFNKYQNLYTRLKEAILRGEYASGKRFPPEILFARQLGVSRNTLRSALSKLEDEHLVSRRRRFGTFPTPRRNQGSALERYLFSSFVSEQKYANHILPSIIQGLEQAINGHDVELEICQHERLETLTTSDAKTIFSAHSIRGGILYGSCFTGNEPILKLFRELRVPTVLVYCYLDDYQKTGCAAVPQNTAAIWRAALEYLQSIGHSRVLTVGMLGENIRQIFPPETYASLLREIGLDPDRHLVLRCEMAFEDIFEKFQNVFTLTPAPTAILCYSDFWGPLIYRVLQKLNLRVPDDVSVMGYCGAPGSEYMTPALSSAAILYREVGRIAGNMLLSSAEWFAVENLAPPLVMTPYQLLIRNSTKKVTNKIPLMAQK